MDKQFIQQVVPGSRMKDCDEWRKEGGKANATTQYYELVSGWGNQSLGLSESQSLEPLKIIKMLHSIVPPKNWLGEIFIPVSSIFHCLYP